MKSGGSSDAITGVAGTGEHSTSKEDSDSNFGAGSWRADLLQLGESALSLSESLFLKNRFGLW